MEKERSGLIVWEGNEQVQPGLHAWKIKDEQNLEDPIAWESYCCLHDNNNNMVTMGELIHYFEK